MSRPRTAAEFFAGIGLVRMALERAGWRVVFANDIDPMKFEMYRENFGPSDFVLNDIRNVRPQVIPDVALATASFPCIDLSLAGNRSGLSGNHSSAYWEFHKAIEIMGERRPHAVLLENVVGLISSNGGDDLRSIIASLGKLGYGCDLLLVDAVHFVPQSRPRLFIIGLQNPLARVTDLSPNGVRSDQIINFIRRNSDLNWYHLALPPLPPKRQDLDRVVERLDSSASEWWDKRRQAHLFSQMSALHKGLLRRLMNSKNPIFATVYKRVRPNGCRAEVRADGVAGCLRPPRGGSSKQFLIQAGQGTWRVRNMTAREYARLQGVPDSFKITVPYNKALFGFGDAVCVPVVEWVVRHAIP